MKKCISLFLAFLCCFSASAALRKPREVIVHDTVYVEVPMEMPSLYQFGASSDTLFLLEDSLMLPRYLTIVMGSDTVQFKQLIPDMEFAMDSVPASDHYDIWQNSRVNPYNTPIDSIKKPVEIDVRGFRLPHPGVVTSGYGQRKYRWHYGTDLRVAVGDSIRAAWDGVVRIVGWDPRGYGRYVVIRHDNGLETVYGHLSLPLFDENERIFAGEVLGLGGNTGRSTGPHLHWEMRYLGNAFNTALLVDYSAGQLRCGSDSIYTISKQSTWPEREVIKSIKAAKYVTIREGDTLSAIAKRNHTTVNALCRLNGIKQTTIIRAGKKLRVQ